jgi:aminocarboxymuconate-semialdehyde decarboxylase
MRAHPVATAIANGRRSPMKKIDAFNHIFPKGFYEKMMEVAGGLKDMGKRVRGVPMLVDLDERFRVMDRFGPDYVQILSLASPPLEVAGPNATPKPPSEPTTAWPKLCRKYRRAFRPSPAAVIVDAAWAGCIARSR